MNQAGILGKTATKCHMESCCLIIPGILISLPDANFVFEIFIEFCKSKDGAFYLDGLWLINYRSTGG